MITRTSPTVLYEDVLRRLSQKEMRYKLNVANKLVVHKDYPILESYKRRIGKHFMSTIDAKDFVKNSNEVINDINEWVKGITNGKIMKLLDSLDESTIMIILNAIYFNGKWNSEYFINTTREDVFYNNGVDLIKTQMMSKLTYFKYAEIDELNSKLLELPYSGDDVSLYIVLPLRNDGIKQLVSARSHFNLIIDIITRLRRAREVNVSIPIFKIESSYSLKSQLCQMGMNLIFAVLLTCLQSMAKEICMFQKRSIKR